MAENGWILPTSEALGVKTEYFWELVTMFKVVYIVIFDIIPFVSKHCPIKSEWIVQDLKIIKFLNLVNFGGQSLSQNSYKAFKWCFWLFYMIFRSE